jgi:hypothetical protein
MLVTRDMEPATLASLPAQVHVEARRLDVQFTHGGFCGSPRRRAPSAQTGSLPDSRSKDKHSGDVLPASEIPSAGRGRRSSERSALLQVLTGHFEGFARLYKPAPPSSSPEQDQERAIYHKPLEELDRRERA